MNRTPWRAYLCLAGSMAIVGGYVGLSKALLAVFPVFLLAWLRFGIAAVAMAPWLRRSAGEAPLDARHRRLLFLESLFGNFLFSICMLFGVAWSSAVAAGIVMGALPAVVAVFSRLLLDERITPKVGLGIACAAGGIALVAWGGRVEPAQAPGHALGHLLLLGAVCCEALYVVIGKRLTAQVGAKRISAVINLWGLALVTPFGVVAALAFDFAAVSAAAWAGLAGYSIAASVVTVWLWMTGLKEVDAAAAGTFTVFLPISAAAFGTVFLGEPFSAVQGVAFALALAGILLATVRAPESAPRPPTSPPRVPTASPPVPP